MSKNENKKVGKVKTFLERKNEEAASLQKKEEQLKEILNTIKSNSKFAKLIEFSLENLNKLFSPEYSEKYINVKSTMKLDGIKILSDIASTNINNDDLICRITDVLKTFIVYDDPKSHELSKLFVEKQGHSYIFQLLGSIKNEHGIVSLLNIVEKLVEVPQLSSILLDSGLVDTLKYLNDKHNQNLKINDILHKIMSKATNHRKGRELLLNNNIIPGIISYVNQNMKSNNVESVFNGLIILDNMCKNEKGKAIIKELKTYIVLGEILSTFFNDKQILHKCVKIFSKIITNKELGDKIATVKNILNTSNNLEQNMNELNELLNYISNFMIVQDIENEVCSLDNMIVIIGLFNKLYEINLENKNKQFLNEYITLMKHFMIIFKRVIESDPEYLDNNNNKGKLFLSIIQKILYTSNKNWEGILPFLKEAKNNDAINIYKNFFSEYCVVFVKIYNLNKISEIISILEYILEKIILFAKEYFYNDEKVNYHFSLLLKIINEIIIDNQENIENLYNHLINCFPYFKTVITKSENWVTLSNFLDIIYSLIKYNKINSATKEDIIPIITNFMINKPKFRYPNLVNLKILDKYLTPQFTKNYLSKRKKVNSNQNGNEDNIENNDNVNDINSNPNYNLDFSYAICSVMVKGFYDFSNQKKEKRQNENDYINEFIEEKNKDTEKSILMEGGKLLKRLISQEEFLEKVNLLKELVKDYQPGRSSDKDVEILQDNIIFQICALSLNEYLHKGIEDVFKCIKDLIIKEINYIEYYKRENAKNKNAKEYKEKCNKSSTMLNLGLMTLRKIEDGAIYNYNKGKEEKYIKLLKDIISLNIEIIDKSSDSINQISHLKQLKKNLSFLFKNEKIIKSGQSVIEQYINSLISLFRKNVENEDLCLSIIEIFRIISNYNKQIYNLLVKSGCSKIILQSLELTNNNKLCLDSLQLLKNMCLSKQENLVLIANQNILISLFEIRTKFLNEVKITECIDQIVNEIMKLPEQGIHIQEILLDAIKDFHENMNQPFAEEKIKNKILNDLIIIKSYTTSKTQIKNLLTKKEFIQDFIQCVKQTLETNESTQLIEKLFTCEVELIKKLKDQIPVGDNEESDKLHEIFSNFLLEILFHKAIFSESFLLTANTLLSYIKNNLLYDKFLSNKINEKFIEKLLEQKENYIDNPQISKVINNILSYISLKNPTLAKFIVRKGGLMNILDDLKTLVNLNDEISKQIKCNGLMMVDSLLNENKNMEIFIKSNGNELINNIIKNEILIAQEKENKFIPLESQYKTICCINTDINEKNTNIIKENNNTNNNNKMLNRRISSTFNNDVILRDSMTRGSLKFMSKNSTDIMTDFNNDNLDMVDYENNNDYIFYCMSIINKGLNKNKSEFIDKNTLNNLIKIAEYKFPDKYIFSQLTEFMLYIFKNNKIIEENEVNYDEKKAKENDFMRNKNIIRFVLSNRAFYYSNNNILKKANEIENLVGSLVLEKTEFIEEYKRVLSERYDEKGDSILLKYKLLTYLSLIIDLSSFKKIYEQMKNEIINFFNEVSSKFLSAENTQNLNDNQKSNFIKQKEGILLSLMKLYNYFIEQSIIDKNEPQILENIDSFEKCGISLYSPNNYIFVYEFEKEITKLYEQTVGFILSKSGEKEKKVIKYTKNYFVHLQNIYDKLMNFVEDFCEYIKSSNFIENHAVNEKKENNLDNVLYLVKKYFKTDEDKGKKEELNQILFDTFLNLIGILLKEEIYEIYSETDRNTKRIKLLWKLIFYTLKNDEKNLILEKITSDKISDIIDKINKTIKIKENNQPFLREIILLIVKTIENNDDMYQILFNFVCEDINSYGKTNEEIKNIDLKILSFLSEFHSQMKLILSNTNLWEFLKDEYSRNDLSNEERLQLAIIFKNATKNDKNLENLIKNDSKSIQIILSKVLKDTITSLDNNGLMIIQNEMEAVCNITKIKKYLDIIVQRNIVNNEELKKIETIYDSLDKNICSSYKSILNEIAADDKLQTNLKAVKEDEDKLNEYEQIVITNYEKYISEFIKIYERNKKEESLLDSIVKDELLDGNKKIVGINEIKEGNQIKEKLKSPLSIKNNEKMIGALEQILVIMSRNYNILNSFKEDIYSVNRINIMNKSLNLLQKISLSQDNHEKILLGGLINFLGKITEDYNNDKSKGVNNDINYISNFISKGKFILKECSQSENCLNIILDSPIFHNIITEILEFNQNPKSISINSNTKRIFIYDNAILTNIYIMIKSYEQILKKIDINTLMKLGIKTLNIILLEYITNILYYYIKKNEANLTDEFYDKVIGIMEKCIRNKNRSPTLMSIIFNLAILLYTQKNSQKVDKLKILDSINSDIEAFSSDERYLISALNCLTILVRNNQKYIDDSYEIGLVKKCKKTIFNLTKDNPENYIKILLKLTEFYYYLIKNKPENSNKLCEYDITRNVVKYIDIFNEKIQEKSEPENKINIQDIINNGIIEEPKDNFNNKNENNLIKDDNFDLMSLGSNKGQNKQNLIIDCSAIILMNCINYLDIITTNPEANTYLTTKTSFTKYVIAAIKNDKNDKTFIANALHCLGNYILSNEGVEYLQTNIVDLYQLLSNLQSTYYSNSEILMNINYICSSIIKILTDKNYINMFFDIVAESITCHEWNSNLIKMSLKIIFESLDKKPYIADSANDKLISNIINILKLNKNDNEIQLLCYKILSFFATDNHVSEFSGAINDLLKQIRQSLNSLLPANNEDKDKNIKEKIRKAINNLIIFLGNIEQYQDNISHELIIPFTKELNDYGIDEDTNGAYILNIFDSLFKNNNLSFIAPFINSKGMESLVRIMKIIDNNYNNVSMILLLFSVLIKILKAKDDYKIKAQNLKMPEIINDIIRYTSMLDKKIAFEGKSLLFLINMAKAQLEVVEEVDFADIKEVQTIKPAVKNFLTSGKQVRVINEHGEIKERQLLFSQDLLKVQAKLLNNLPPKPKYVIETNNIKEIIKGYGTDYFKKSGGLFRSAPKPELCLTIIGPKTVEGTKSINVICKTERDVDKWISNIEELINYFQKQKLMGNVVIDKKVRK